MTQADKISAKNIIRALMQTMGPWAKGWFILQHAMVHIGRQPVTITSEEK